MNRNLKFAIAAAIASLGVTGQAHALTNSTASGSGSLFLYVFEDRQANSLATNSAIFDLGLASAFGTSSNQTFNLSASTGWTDYVATIANPANIHWGVFGTALGTGGTGTKMLTTMASVPASVNGSALNTVVTKYNAEITLYGTNAGSNTAGSTDLASTAWDDSAGYTPISAIMTAGLGSSMNFYQYTSTGTKGTNLATQTVFTTGGDIVDVGGTNLAYTPSTANYFTLSNDGVLTYATAPVPEADSYAMMLAGLGLVGYMVRRRKAA